MPAHPRVNWEFFAILRGRLAPFKHPTDPLTFSANTLWVFPPGDVHGWIGEPKKRSEVVVVHFSSVSPALERVVRERGRLATRLTVSDRKSIRRLGRQLHRHYWQPVGVSDLHVERALIDLSLLALRNIDASQQPVTVGISERKVVQAEDWLNAHLAEPQAIRRAAGASGMSPSHFRRLFQRVRGLTPKDALQRLRFECAMRQMAQSNLKLSAIAAECGFATASNFCRAFKAFKGSSPTAWRRQIFMQYMKPRAGAVTDPRSHGRRRRLP